MLGIAILDMKNLLVHLMDGSGLLAAVPVSSNKLTAKPK